MTAASCAPYVQSGTASLEDRQIDSTVHVLCSVQRYSPGLAVCRQVRIRTGYVLVCTYFDRVRRGEVSGQCANLPGTGAGAGRKIAAADGRWQAVGRSKSPNEKSSRASGDPSSAAAERDDDHALKEQATGPGGQGCRGRRTRPCGTQASLWVRCQGSKMGVLQARRASQGPPCWRADDTRRKRCFGQGLQPLRRTLPESERTALSAH